MYSIYIHTYISAQCHIIHHYHIIILLCNHSNSNRTWLATHSWNSPPHGHECVLQMLPGKGGRAKYHLKWRIWFHHHIPPTYPSNVKSSCLMPTSHLLGCEGPLSSGMGTGKICETLMVLHRELEAWQFSKVLAFMQLKGKPNHQKDIFQYQSPAEKEWAYIACSTPQPSFSKTN